MSTSLFLIPSPFSSCLQRLKEEELQETWTDRKDVWLPPGASEPISISCLLKKKVKAKELLVC